jgi:hypothetical protein
MNILDSLGYSNKPVLWDNMVFILVNNENIYDYLLNTK